MPGPRPLDYRSGEPAPRHKSAPWREWASVLIVCLYLLLIVSVLFVVAAGVANDGFDWR